MFRIVREEIQHIWNQTNWFSRLFVVAMSFSILGFLPYFATAHLPFLALGIAMCLGRYKKVEAGAVLLALYLPLTIIIGDPDPVFRSWQRYIVFLLVFLFASPIMGGEYAAKLRRSVLFAYLGLSTLIALGSFFCYFLGINFMRNQYDGSFIDFYTSTSGFGGLTIHSMVLGPISGIGALYLFYRFINTKGKGRIWYILAVLMCMFTCLFAASRSALMASVSGGLIMLYLSTQKNGGFIATLFVLVLIGMLTLPLWENAANGIINKQQADQTIGQFGSRTDKWTARIDEFKQNPVTGIGFAAIDPNGSDEYNPVTGNIEPGSSWLAILSMTGIMGLLLFLNIIRRPISFLRTSRSSYSALVFGLLFFVLVHMIAEGYIFAGGGVSCFRAWLIIGCAYDQIYGYFEGETVADEYQEEE